MQGNYSVTIEKFAERHFIRGFERKYKTHWDVTLKAIISELQHVDTLLLTDRAETICDGGKIKIIKTKFKVAGTKESAKTSGNRCIVAWRLHEQCVTVLLVYAKTDIGQHNETAEWKGIIRDNYAAYRQML